MLAQGACLAREDLTPATRRGLADQLDGRRPRALEEK
ncbi:hypothetical protein ABH930_002369 [Kitasatospora sp. GAS204A]|nr:hypothetical protein [Kitasatospora sp. GAS204B]